MKYIISLLLVVLFFSCKETAIDKQKSEAKKAFKTYRKMFWVLHDSMDIVLDKQNCFYDCGKRDSAVKYVDIWKHLYDSSKIYYRLMYPNDKPIDAEEVKTKNCNCP